MLWPATGFQALTLKRFCTEPLIYNFQGYEEPVRAAISILDAILMFCLSPVRMITGKLVCIIMPRLEFSGVRQAVFWIKS